MNRACGFIGSPTSPPHTYQQTGFPFTAYAAGYTGSTIPDWTSAWPAPVHSNALNRAYYDPAQTYSPPLDAAGVSFKSMTAANTTNWTKVPADPWAATIVDVNLTSNVNAPLYCNSDWPLDTNWDPGSPFPGGWGNHCRINGVDYNQAFQVSKANAEYQYPWSNVLAQPKDTKHYWRHNFTKTLYCDPASPKWPQTCSTTSKYVCNTGTWIAPAGKSYPQSCNPGALTKVCDTANNADYSPAGCQASPLHASPGTCTKGAECLPCSCTSPSKVTGQAGTCKATNGGDPSSGASLRLHGRRLFVKACANHNVAGTGKGTCSDGSTPVLKSTTTCSKATGTCGGFLWDPVAKAPTTTTMLADSNGAGEVRRHNNQTYGGGPAAGHFNFPMPSTRPQWHSGCSAVGATVAVPRHYWKTSVEWCSGRLAITDPSIWRGYGQGGTCRDDRDATYRWPRFYKWGVPKTDAAYLDNVTHAAFEKVSLTSTIASYTIRSGATRVATITRTYAEEMTNYANWFAYYRTRIQAAKTVISQNFTYLDNEFRVGFHTLSNAPTSSFVNVAPFDPAQKALWYAQLFNIKIPMGNNTPNMEAMMRIGEWFSSGSSGALSGATDPIVLSCQRNFHMLFTDGAQNQTFASTPAPGDRDQTVSIPYDLPLAVPPLINGAVWTPPYKQGTAMANTLSDFAMKYWATDLRTGMIDDSIKSSRDPAPWQHLNFAALALGTKTCSTAARYQRPRRRSQQVRLPGQRRRRAGAVSAAHRRRGRSLARRSQRARTFRQRKDLAGAWSRHSRDPARSRPAAGYGLGGQHHQSEPGVRPTTTCTSPRSTAPRELSRRCRSIRRRLRRSRMPGMRQPPSTCSSRRRFRSPIRGTATVGSLPRAAARPGPSNTGR